MATHDDAAVPPPGASDRTIPHPPPVCAVLLAAGAGRRMGGRCKGRLELDGIPLLHARINAFLAAGVAQLVVVTGHHAPALAPLLQAFPGVMQAHHPDPDQGQGSSVQRGLAALTLPGADVLIGLVDQPLVQSRQVRVLLDAFQRRQHGLLLVPRVAGRPGNPVVISAALRQQWLALPASEVGRAWRVRHPEQVAWLDSEDAAYCCDLDTPEDLAAFAARTGRVLRWPVDEG